MAAKATVHGYAAASVWAAGIFVLAALVGGVLIDVHPGQPVADPSGADADGAS